MQWLQDYYQDELAQVREQSGTFQKGPWTISENTLDFQLGQITNNQEQSSQIEL